MSDSEAPIVELADVQKFYRGKAALSIDHLRISHQERVLLWGGNGSGKSTLLRILAGVTVPTRGSYRVTPTFRCARRALLPQKGGLYEDLTARQNLLILAQLYDWQPDEAPLAMLLDGEVERYLDAPLRTLSGGMERIVSIAIFLSLRPHVLFLDEPFGGLDAEHSARLRTALSDYGARIHLLVVAEHDAATFDDSWRKIGLVDGRVRKDA